MCQMLRRQQWGGGTGEEDGELSLRVYSLRGETEKYLLRASWS